MIHSSSHSDNDAAFDLLISCVQDHAIYQLSSTGEICRWNLGLQRLYGYSEAEIIGQHHALLYTEDSQQLDNPNQDLEQALALGQYESQDWRRRKDGSHFLAQVTLKPLRNPDGELSGFAQVTRDISLRQRMEERFRRVVEYSPSAMIMINPRGLIEMVNTQTEGMFGYSRAEMLGQAMEFLLPTRLREHHPSLREAFFANPSPRPMGAGRELFGLRKDGQEFPIEIGLNPIDTDDGIMVLSVIVDISERKRLEQRFRQVVQEAPNAMVMTNKQGLIMLFNRQAEKTFGYQQQEVIGQALEVLVPERFRQAHSLRSGFTAQPEARPMAGRELYGLHKDGTEFPVEIGLNPIETEDGTMVLAAIVDIKSRKLAQQQIEAALKEKTVLLNEIHHRVKNNLQVIISLLNMQANYEPEGNTKNVLIDSQARVRSMALIHQLLYERHDFSRVDLGEYLQRFGQLLLSSFGSITRRISLEVEAETVYIELQRATPCGLLINELVTNAFKHAYPSAAGTVSIQLRMLSRNQAVLIVADHGVGLPDPSLVEHSKTLGLQLVPILADQIGASLTVHDNQPGVRFELQLPVMEEEDKLA